MSFFRKLFCPKYKSMKKKYSLVKSENEALKNRLSKLEGGENPYLFTPTTHLTDGRRISRTELTGAMTGYMYTNVDAEYETIERSEVEDILKGNTAIELAQYIKNDHDCDDFAFALHGLFNHPRLSSRCFGWARSQTHAFNFFIDKDLQVWVVEPQNNKVMKYSKDIGELYRIISYIV